MSPPALSCARNMVVLEKAVPPAHTATQPSEPTGNGHEFSAPTHSLNPKGMLPLHSPPESGSDPDEFNDLVTPRHAILLDTSILTPPKSSPLRPIEFNTPLVSLPDLEFPSPACLPPVAPPQLEDLTPSLFHKLLCESSTGFTISCSITDFRQWHEGNPTLLDYRGRWEYNALTSKFIIHSCPTAVHECFIKYALDAINCRVREITSMRPYAAGVTAGTNTHLRLDQSPGSLLLPDVFTEVELAGGGLRRCIMFEVGNTQSLQSLKQKAHTWLYYTDDVHLVMVIDLQEIHQAYQDKDGTVVAKSTAQDRACEWPRDWEVEEHEEGQRNGHRRRGGEWFEDELRKRGGDRAAISTFKVQVVKEMAAWMLQEDQKNQLIPALVEPLDGHAYLYRRAPGVDPTSELLQEPAPDDTQATSQATEDSDEEFPTLECIFNSKFLSQSTVVLDSPNTVPLTIGEMFGPLPIPSCLCQEEQPISASVLRDIPMHLQRHANETIILDMHEVGEYLIKDMRNIKPDLAEDRAAKVVEAAYRVFFTRADAEKTRLEQVDRRDKEEQQRDARRMKRDQAKGNEHAAEEAPEGSRKRKAGGQGHVTGGASSEAEKDAEGRAGTRMKQKQVKRDDPATQRGRGLAARALREKKTDERVKATKKGRGKENIPDRDA